MTTTLPIAVSSGASIRCMGECYFRTITVKNAPDTLPAAMSELDALPFEHRYTVRWIGMEHATA